MEEDKLKCEFQFQGSTITTSLSKNDFSESDLNEILLKVKNKDAHLVMNGYFTPCRPGDPPSEPHRRHFIFTLENGKKVHVEYSISTSKYITIRMI